MSTPPVNSLATWALLVLNMVLPDKLGDTAADLIPGERIKNSVAQGATGHRPQVAALHPKQGDHLIHLRDGPVIMNKNQSFAAERLFHPGTAGQNDPMAARQAFQPSGIRFAWVQKCVEPGQTKVPNKPAQGAVGDESRCFLPLLGHDHLGIECQGLPSVCKFSGSFRTNVDGDKETSGHRRSMRKSIMTPLGDEICTCRGNT